MKVFRSDRDSPGGGAALFVRSSLPCTEISFSSPDSLCCMLKLSPNIKCLIVVIYRPPTNSTDLDNSLLRDLSSVLSLPHDQTLIMGDFNLPRLFDHPPSSDVLTTGLLDLMHSHPLYNHCFEPTRFRSNNKPSLLDLILTNDELMIDKVDVLAPLGLSDHSFLHFHFTYWSDKQSCSSTFIRRRTDYVKLNALIASADWTIDPEASADVCWSSFSDRLRVLCDTCTTSTEVPLRKLCTIPLRSRTRKWIALRNKAWARYRCTPTTTHWEEYRLLRNQVTTFVRDDRSQYQHQLSLQFAKNPKSLFSYVNRLRHVKPGVTALLTPNGLTETPFETAEILKQQYSSVYYNSTMVPPVIHPDLNQLESLSNIEFTPPSIFRKLRNLKPNASPGPDGFHPKTLRVCAVSLCSPLADLFTHLFSRRSVPTEWKCGSISPIHKGGSRTDASNYRPITLLSVISKVMESIIADSIMQHMEEHRLLSHSQHGFRRQHSCLTNLLIARDQWTSAIDCGLEVHVIYLDFSKAFDRVSHSLLLQKLALRGVSGPLLDWLLNYLTDRTARVRVDGAFSSPFSLPTGVPQGSVLGPDLFLTFIDDVSANLASPSLLYADDVKLWRVISSSADHQLLQEDLTRLYHWSLTNYLPFNLSKCRVLSTRPTMDPSYHLGSHKLQVSHSERDLGVITESSLSVSNTCSRAAKTANAMLGLLRRAFRKFEADGVALLLQTFLRPHLEFAVQAWSPWLVKDQIALEAPQRRATKLVRGLEHLSYQTRLSRLGMYSTKYRRLRGDLILVYCILNSPTHPCRPLLELNTRTPHLRGHPLRLTHKRSRINCRRYFFSVRVSQLWNSLPAAVVCSPSLSLFKRRLDNHLMDHHLSIP